MNLNLFKPIGSWWKAIRLRSRFDPEILLELLEHETDRDTILEILDLDIMDESSIRVLLKKASVIRLSNLGVHLDRRIALRIILKEKIQDDTLKKRLRQSLAYPLLLFFLSLGMMLFADTILIRSFRSMLDFIGPDKTLGLSQIIIRSGLVLDGILLVTGLILAVAIKSNPVKVYGFMDTVVKQHVWQRLVTIRFLSRFMMLYDLGFSTDQILLVIEKSTDPVLSMKIRKMSAGMSSGQLLSDAVIEIDQSLHQSFRMSEEGYTDETPLINTLKQRESRLKLTVKRTGMIVLAYAYLKITLIIILIYALMLKPIELMENLV